MEVVKKLMEEERDRVHAEERLEHSCNDQLTLETWLQETHVVDVQHAHENDVDKGHDERLTRSFLEKKYQNTASQTQTGSMIPCDVEPKPPWSEEMEQARESIASREMEIMEVEQRLADWTVRANEAMEDARRSKKLASQRQEEIDTLNKRQQVRRDMMRAYFRTVSV